jgi:hypothetical protein
MRHIYGIELWIDRRHCPEPGLPSVFLWGAYFDIFDPTLFVNVNRHYHGKKVGVGMHTLLGC